MAKTGRFVFDVAFDEVERNLKTAVSKVQRGTKKATQEACETIQKKSLKQVPKHTSTLASSFSYSIQGSSSDFTAELGYAIRKDPINPLTGKRASSYMVAVHEDLSAYHPIGKAKFLEDPINEYASRFGRRYAHVIKNELGK